VKTSIFLLLKKTTITPQQEVQDKCDGESFCRLEAKNGIFGDPCPGVAKYLTVTWKCNSLIRELYCVHTFILGTDPIGILAAGSGFSRISGRFLVHTTELLMCIK